MYGIPCRIGDGELDSSHKRCKHKIHSKQTFQKDRKTVKTNQGTELKLKRMHHIKETLFHSVGV